MKETAAAWAVLFVVGMLLCGCTSDEVLVDEQQQDVVYYRARGHVVAPGSFFPDGESEAAVNAAAEALGQKQVFETAPHDKGVVKALPIEGVWNVDFYRFRRRYELPVRVFWCGKNGSTKARMEDEVLPVYAEVLVAERPYSRRIERYLALNPAQEEFVAALNEEYRKRMKSGSVLRQVGAPAEEVGRILDSEKPQGAGSAGRVDSADETM